MSSSASDRRSVTLADARWVLGPPGLPDWSATHAQAPCGLNIEGAFIRCWYTSRDSAGRSHIGWADLHAEEPWRVRAIGQRPCLGPGRAGHFDDAGVMVSCVVAVGDKLRLYYVGWNVGGSVPYRLAIGIAESDDQGLTFQRLSDGPFVDRSATDPVSVTMPEVWMSPSGQFMMRYASLLPWSRHDGRWESAYALRSAISDDGLRWIPSDWLFENPPDPGRAAVRTTHLVENGQEWVMYCARDVTHFRGGGAGSYRIHAAQSLAGSLRPVGPVDLDPRPIWATEMTAYPWVIEGGGSRWVLFNGNGFGRDGFGVAKICINLRHTGSEDVL